MNFKQWLSEWEGNTPATGQNFNGASMTSHGIRSKYVADDAQGGKEKDNTEIGDNMDKAKAKFGFETGDELLKLAWADRNGMKMKKKMRKK